MKSCKEREKILELVSNNLSASEARVLKAHLKDCQQCAQEKEEIEQVWNALSSLDEVDVPAVVREETLEKIYTFEDSKGWWTSSVGRFVPLSLGHTLIAIIFGIAMILFYGLILTRRVDLKQFTPGELLITIVIWSGVFILAFCFLFSGSKVKKVNLRFASGVGIVATGVTMVGAFFCPEATFFQMWINSKTSAFIAKMTGISFSHFVFGIIYGFLPAISSATALGFKFKGDITKNGLVAALSFVALVLPATYLQCRYLSLWVIMISFSVGILSGAISGIFAGLGVTRLKQRWSAV